MKMFESSEPVALEFVTARHLIHSVLTVYI